MHWFLVMFWVGMKCVVGLLVCLGGGSQVWSRCPSPSVIIMIKLIAQNSDVRNLLPWTKNCTVSNNNSGEMLVTDVFDL